MDSPEWLKRERQYQVLPGQEATRTLKQMVQVQGDAKTLETCLEIFTKAEIRTPWPMHPTPTWTLHRNACK